MTNDELDAKLVIACGYLRGLLGPNFAYVVCVGALDNTALRSMGNHTPDVQKALVNAVSRSFDSGNATITVQEVLYKGGTS